MLGAILGDIIGSPYEFDSHNYKAKDFPLFSEHSRFTDDSVMTLAVADALMSVPGDAAEDDVHAALIRSMQTLGRKYPYCGYGIRFSSWLRSEEPKPYHSWGNGSAMRVASVGWLYNDMAEVRRAAKWTAEVTHDHPEGIKGAEATAAAIFLARSGCGKDEIRRYTAEEFGYDLDRTCDEIRPGYHMDESCQRTVPEAIIAFLESTDFEDAIRTAVSLGGDSDTLAAITGSIAEAFYGMPAELAEEGRNRLTEDLRAILERFEHERG